MESLAIDHGVAEEAKKGADYAKSIAPVFGDLPPKRGEPGLGEPGDYKESIGTKHMSTAKVPTWRVFSDDPKAIWIELGSTHMPEYAVFAKMAAYFGGTGPVIDEGVQHAQGKLRQELEKFEKLTATGAEAALIAEQKAAVSRARIARSSAFKAARGPRRRR